MRTLAAAAFLALAVPAAALSDCPCEPQPVESLEDRAARLRARLENLDQARRRLSLKLDEAASRTPAPERLRALTGNELRAEYAGMKKDDSAYSAVYTVLDSRLAIEAIEDQRRTLGKELAAVEKNLSPDPVPSRRGWLGRRSS